MTPTSVPLLSCHVWLRAPQLALASDLHLDPFAPTPRQETFLAWLASLPPGMPFVILGDLFDFWIGDDWRPEPFVPLFAALAAAAQKRPLFFQAGNRDFLAGRALARRIGWRRLPPLAGAVVGARRVLLTHGDALCWEDTAYLAWRQQARDPRWQRAFLAQPLAARLAFAQAARRESRRRPDYPTDVSEAAVAALFARYPGADLVHGHTHRPHARSYPQREQTVYRWVLPEWCDDGPPAGRLLTESGLVAG